MRRSPCAALVGIALAIAHAALAQESPSADPLPRGPAIGDNAYTTEIRSFDGEADVDDYVSPLRTGETLSVVVQAARRSAVLPRLVVLGPEGDDVHAKVRTAKAGRMQSVRSFKAPATGRYTVRVSGQAGSEGRYVIAFSVRPVPPTILRHQQVGNAEPTFRITQFAGLDGALLDLKLTWNRHSVPVEIRALTDPAGHEVAAPGGGAAVLHAETKGRTLTLAGVPLHDGDGDYAFRVRILQGEAIYDASIAVVPQGRPRGRKPVVLDAAELVLDARTDPLPGRPGFILHLTGRGFATSPLPRIWFGRNEATIAGVVAGDGRSLDVTVPQGVPGSSVAVTVQNPDGQAAVRPDYFAYLQPIQVKDLVDDAGAPVRDGSAKGGRTLHLRGAFFESGQTVSFGTSNSQVLSVPAADEMLVVTPASAAGLVRIVVHDRFGGTATSPFEFRFKTPPTFDAKPYTPSVTAVQTAAAVTLTGRDFEAVDQLSFDGAPVNSVFVDSRTRTFDVPPLPAGSYAVTLTDSIGTVERGPDFVVKPPPQIGSISIIAGPHVGARGVPVEGGCTVQVDGANFHYTDLVELGGTTADILSSSATRFTFVAPSGALGDADLSITDGAAQTSTLAAALRYVGYDDATSVRSAGSTAVDDLAADRGIVGDLDRDGKADDVVIATSYQYVGTRPELTRILLGDASGRLVDATATNFPAAGSDVSGTDDWNATALAIGDVDGTNGPDIVISGFAPISYYGAYKSVRMFVNDGSGHFTQNEAIAPAAGYTAAVFARDATGTYFLVYGTVFEQGVAGALAVGDLDRDGDQDLVVGRDHYDYRYVGINPAQVNFAANPPSVPTTNPTYLSYFQYHSATKVYANDAAHGHVFVETTATAMPSCGNSNIAPVPCFEAKDLALGDIDLDGDLDLVETWNDPTTVTAFGTYQGSGADTPRVATRVLVNDGTGHFADRTSSWLPAGAAPEFWQGDRMALADLDNDGDLDLVLLHAQGTDAYLGTPAFDKTALRILRNDASPRRFVDVTSSAVPALPAGDNFRGAALAVRDIDRDGRLDIVIGTSESLTDASSAPLRATRLLRGGPGLTFALESVFLPAATSESGETTDVLAIGDLAGNPEPSLILLATSPPQHGPTGENLRVLDWKR